MVTDHLLFPCHSPCEGDVFVRSTRWVFLGKTISRERNIILNRLATLPETNHLGSNHHTLFLDTTDVYRRLHDPHSDFASKWSKQSLNQFANSLDSTPEDYIPSEEEMKRFKKVLLPGDVCSACTRNRTHALDVSKQIRDCLKKQCLNSIWYYGYV